MPTKTDTRPSTVWEEPNAVQIKVTIFNLLFAVFLFGGLWTGRNFFKYVFDKTFHYTREGWDKFTWNFAWFFVATAVANELVRQGFAHAHYEFSGYKLDGINIWILFKLFIVMPLSGLFTSCAKPAASVPVAARRWAITRDCCCF